LYSDLQVCQKCATQYLGVIYELNNEPFMWTPQSISKSARPSVSDLNLLNSRHEFLCKTSLQQISCPAKISSLNICLVTAILQFRALKNIYSVFSTYL